MPSSDVLNSISKVWPYSKKLEFSDEGYFINTEMSDADSDDARGATVSLPTGHGQLPVWYLIVCSP